MNGLTGQRDDLEVNEVAMMTTEWCYGHFAKELPTLAKDMSA